MLTIWLLTGVSFLFGVANGVISSAAPQAVDALRLSSLELGLVGAGVPLGYAVSCLFCARYFSKMAAKRVLLGGVTCGALAMLLMASARSSAVLVSAQLFFGLSAGAVWPFISSWMLEFEAAGIPKPRLLRHYNVSWTGGTATGMLAGGVLCQQGWIFQAFQAGAATVAVAVVLTALSREPHQRGAPLPVPIEPLCPPPSESTRRARVTWATLLAAVLFNFMAIGSKTIIAVNYAELNKALGGGADRMGLLIAVGLLSQLAAFGAGKWYEPFLGLRRVYVLGALILIAENWVFTQTTWLPALILGEMANGFVLALSFQCSMLAFTARSATPRGGTTLMEATVGAAGLAPLAAGALSDNLKKSGIDTLDALRAPFYAAIGLITAVLVAQLFLVPALKERRKLMRGPA